MYTNAPLRYGMNPLNIMFVSGIGPVFTSSTLLLKTTQFSRTLSAALLVIFYEFSLNVLEFMFLRLSLPCYARLAKHSLAHSVLLHNASVLLAPRSFSCTAALEHASYLYLSLFRRLNLCRESSSGGVTFKD